MADIFLVMQLGQRLERLRKKTEKRAVGCGGIPRSYKDKCDKEVKAREKTMLQIKDKPTVAILIYINIQKQKRYLN